MPILEPGNNRNCACSYSSSRAQDRSTLLSPALPGSVHPLSGPSAAAQKERMTTSAIFEKLILHAPHISSKQLIPAFIYGTAWKKDATSDLVYQALCNGFTAIDTAAQPKHYREDLVAAGVSRAIKDGKVKRSDLYLQTKFTSVQGQDPDNMPYDKTSPVTDQVNASVMSSLHNFNFADVVKENDSVEPYIDILILHSPMRTVDETLEVWRTLEQYVPNEIRNLGISNCNLFTLMDLYERSTIKPSVVQNRFYAATKFDIGVRKFCQEKNIVYESFWTLSANPSLVWSVEVGALANQIGVGPQSVLYCLVLGLGNITILNGTKSSKHMQEDWDAVQKVTRFAESYPQQWENAVAGFRALIGQPRP
ncbi:hypothetical protein LTR99_007265 [Exophiala xenobiotica]|uniref:NADP-dependent oxidoreductase domain-containing protein n=1 Tax=Vermiconidia calcicola TaxID=1690605 RepID=A0AAV9Q260_9PEZI|nr:hypothetical protein LTR96_007905 [Exophiala xenobiotica]KAK5534375.1 hypothetical protein LTR25_006407 [Vermiconidia calcicola]KAK5536178.1 hypothetical protein LTR23_008199 [Chaetothyriales sp. CCFEE 6169]KAK5298997.1 hypothetical protein LTR99_007265 [Exophiala xenobiotica]KAK5334685.1 hypothetical protein LTR98_009058 [Exophiala xenobiotica]